MPVTGQIIVVDANPDDHLLGVAEAAGLAAVGVSDNTDAEALFTRFADAGDTLDLAQLDMNRVRGMRGMQLLRWLRESSGDLVLPGGLRLRALPVVVHSPTLGPNSWKALRRIDKGVPKVEDVMAEGALVKAWSKKLAEHVVSLGEELAESEGDTVDTWSLSGSRADIEALLARYTTLSEALRAQLG